MLDDGGEWLVDICVEAVERTVGRSIAGRGKRRQGLAHRGKQPGYFGRDNGIDLRVVQFGVPMGEDIPKADHLPCMRDVFCNL